MQIGLVSKQVGVSIDAIRFYERNGLLAAPTRSEGGFRLYSPNDLSALQFIRSLQTLGFDLTGIFCTSGSEREFTLKERWYADEEIQAGADRDAAAAD